MHYADVASGIILGSDFAGIRQTGLLLYRKPVKFGAEHHCRTGAVFQNGDDSGPTHVLCDGVTRDHAGAQPALPRFGFHVKRVPDFGGDQDKRRRRQGKRFALPRRKTKPELSKSGQHYKQEGVCESHCGANDIGVRGGGAIDGVPERHFTYSGSRQVLRKASPPYVSNSKGPTFAAIDSRQRAGVPFNVMAVACTSERASSAGSTSRHKHVLSASWRKYFCPSCDGRV